MKLNIKRSKIASLLILLICMSTLSIALAMLIPQVPYEAEVEESFKPQPLGRFSIKIGVKEVSDVYGWQVGLRFNPSKLSMVDYKLGDFLGNPTQNVTLSEKVADLGPTLFFYSLFPDGTLVLCQTLKGETPPRSGSGTLVIIEFQYYSQDFDTPYLIFNDPARGTMLLRKDATEIPISKDCITFEILP
ncbi:MAG: cohesin domain-containing protein [Candidatus Bathyarchaeia archaeon]